MQNQLRNTDNVCKLLEVNFNYMIIFVKNASENEIIFIEKKCKTIYFICQLKHY